MANASSIAAAINPLAVLKRARQPQRYSLETYLRREEKSPERFEYFDGNIKKRPMAKGPHNEIAVNVSTAIKNAVKLSGKPFRVFASNQKIYLPLLNFGLYPDAVVICEQPEYWDDNQLLLVNPLAIVEILSKNTRSYDRGNKFDEYKTLPSFKEYILIEQDKCRVETDRAIYLRNSRVLIEQDKCRVETRFREEPDLWRETTCTQVSDKILLKSIGCEIALADIYEHIDI